MSQPCVWIAVHDLSRSGVPLVLHRYLGALSRDERRRVHVVALRDGPMRKDLDPLVAEVVVLGPAEGRWMDSTLSAALLVSGHDHAAGRVSSLGRRVRSRRLPAPDVLVVHGAGAWPIAELVDPSVPVVVHLHEMESALRRCIPENRWRAVMHRASRVLAVSGPVAALAHRAGATDVEIVPGVVDQMGTTATAADLPVPAELCGSPERHTPSGRNGGARGAVDVDVERRWVLGAGRPSWRKGTDRLAPLGYELRRRSPSAAVGWVGGRPGGADGEWLGSTSPVRWFDERTDPWTILDHAAIVVVPSREDPLPLVALEAGARAKPVVSFDSGGLGSLLDEGRGFLVPAQSVRQLCDIVVHLIDSPGAAVAAGARLAEHVRRHHVADVVVPAWWGSITDAALRPT